MSISPYLVRLFLAIGAIAGSSFSLRAAPVLIDDFSTDLASTMTSTTADGTMLGGEIDLDFGALGTFEISGGVGELSGPPGSGSILIIYDGDDDAAETYAFALPDVDLTDGGKNDRFEVDLTSVTGSIDVTVWVYESISDGKFLKLSGVTEAGVLIFPFADFVDDGTGTDLSAAKSVGMEISVDSGEGFAISSIRTAATPDTTKPKIKFTRKGKLKSPRRKHTIKGTVPDDVVRVEVKSRLRKGWRRARLKPSGRWVFRTPRLKAGRNRFKVRAFDSSGNRSRVMRVTVLGVSGLDLGSGR